MKTVVEFLLLVLRYLVKLDIKARLFTSIKSIFKKASRNYFKLTFGKRNYKIVKSFNFYKVTRN